MSLLLGVFLHLILKSNINFPLQLCRPHKGGSMPESKIFSIYRQNLSCLKCNSIQTINHLDPLRSQDPALLYERLLSSHCRFCGIRLLAPPCQLKRYFPSRKWWNNKAIKPHNGDQLTHEESLFWLGHSKCLFWVLICDNCEEYQHSALDSVSRCQQIIGFIADPLYLSNKIETNFLVSASSHKTSRYPTPSNIMIIRTIQCIIFGL